MMQRRRIMAMQAAGVFDRRGVTYLLRDEFTTDAAAGAVNDTAAEPGPGTRRNVGQETELSIAGGYLIGAAGTSPGPSCAWTETFARAVGRVAFTEVVQTAWRFLSLSTIEVSRSLICTS